MRDLSWLTARPIAHRGLHDPNKGIIENTPSAVAAAIDHDYAIEVDLQMSGDGEAMVFHDETLDRLTADSGPIAGRSAEDLRSVRFHGTPDRMATLGDLLDQVAGRAALILELKSPWSGDTALARRTADVLSAYRGPVAVMSFDPALIGAFRRLAPDRIRGIVACGFERSDPEWRRLSRWQRMKLRYLFHMAQTRPQFISYDIKGLQSAVPRMVRGSGLPLITWTVRSTADAEFSARWADQITFEGFLP